MLLSLGYCAAWMRGLKKKVRQLFDLAYFIAKESLAFSKTKPLCDLQQRHGVDIGLACATFIEFIARDLKNQLTEALHSAKFFSIQMDGSTDISNMEEELLLAIFLTPMGMTVCIYDTYFCVRQRSSVDAVGLFQCLIKALAYVGMDGEVNKLIGFGYNGANIKMGENGVRRLLEKERP